MKKIGVLGAGSWGTALTWLLTNNGHEVTLWSIMEAEVEMLRTKREHTSKLPGVKLQDSIQLTSNLEEAMTDKDVLVLAVPSPFTRSTAQKMAPYLKKGQIVVNVAKGVEEHTLMTLSQIIEEELPEVYSPVLAVIKTPNQTWVEEIGYNDGYLTVYDPLDSSKNGSYLLSSIWGQQSNDKDDKAYTSHTGLLLECSRYYVSRWYHHKNIKFAYDWSNSGRLYQQRD